MIPAERRIAQQKVLLRRGDMLRLTLCIIMATSSVYDRQLPRQANAPLLGREAGQGVCRDRAQARHETGSVRRGHILVRPVLPGNRLEALKGDRKGQYSIRLNDQWRSCFEWPRGADGPVNVEVVNYHQEKSVMARKTIHPGEHLAEQLEALDMSAAELARQLRVPTNRITLIINGRRAITGDTALRLGHFFGTSAEFWLNLQKLYELCLAEQRSGAAVKALPRLKDWAA